MSAALFYRSKSYVELTRNALGNGVLGRWLSTLLGIMLFGFTFGSLVAYIVVMGDVFPTFCSMALGPNLAQVNLSFTISSPILVSNPSRRKVWYILIYFP